MVLINTTDQTTRDLSTTQFGADLARPGGRGRYPLGMGETRVLVWVRESHSAIDQLDSIDTAKPLQYASGCRDSGTLQGLRASDD